LSATLLSSVRAPDTFRLLVVAIGILWLSLFGSPLIAQTGSPLPALSGVVLDAQDAVVPGATIVLTNQLTNVSRPGAVSNDSGLFTFAAVDPGVYTIKASHPGFATTMLTDLRVVTAKPASVRIHLDVGPVTQEAEVRSGTPLIQTQSAAVAFTVGGDQLRNLPLITKSALNYVTLLPGVDTGGVHVPRTNTTISGLPQTALAVTIDGINTQDNYGKSSDGFFSVIAPSVDAVEESTLLSATPGADSTGQGAVQIKFITRSGTSTYLGSAYEYFRHPRLNANTFFNIVNDLPKNDITLNQYGANVGGPLKLPGFGDGRRAFFFMNYEVFHLPADVTRTRVVMSDAARAGTFQYSAGGTVRSVNVLQLGASKNQVSAIDPTIGHLLGDIAAATKTTGTLTPNVDRNTDSFVFNPSALNARYMPTARVDLNLTPRQRFTGTYYFQRYNTSPDMGSSLEPRFPGFPSYASQFSNRHALSAGLRSIATPTLVNELLVGLLRSPVAFGDDATLAMFQNQGGFALGFRPSPSAGFAAFNLLDIPTAGSSANNPASAGANNPQTRNNSDWSFDDTVHWQRGRHSLQFGGNFIRVNSWTRDQQLAPSVTFGVDSFNDPANGLFTTANFPGASVANLNDARHLYALLTGRVTSIQGQLALNAQSNQYVYNGVADRRVHMTEAGVFAQDSWRAKPTLTFNYGLRYELQFPMTPESGLYSMSTIADACGVSGTGDKFSTRCNVFSPGTLTGVPTPGYRQYEANNPGYDTDVNNLAPSLGVAWQPNLHGAFARNVLGDPESTTVRAGYARAFTREGLGGVASSGLAQVYEANPGLFVQLTRNANNGNLVKPGETWPLLLSQTNRMGPGDFSATPQYPLPVSRSNSLNLFDPAWQVGYADSYSVGFERALAKSTIFQLMYVGTRGKDLREQENWNELNIVENGFFDEFKTAQSNLYANVAAGRGQTIAYFGAGSGTSPLPIFLAFFNGQPAAQAANPARYTGSNWSNAPLISTFVQLNPSPAATATLLNNSQTFRDNATKLAGLPVNFFQLNPDVGAINVQVSKASTRYDSLQLDLRRYLSNGLAFDVNYTYAKRWQSRLDSLHTARYMVPSTAGVPHALKLAALYELPVGTSRKFLSNANGWLDAAVGGWSLAMTGRIQSGQVLDFGNVRLVGMSVDDLQNALEYRIDTSGGTPRVYNLPQDIIDNTVKAFSVNVAGYTAGTPTGRYLAPASGPDCIQKFRGDCAPADIIVTAPPFTRFDASARKTFRTGGKTTFSFEVDVFNLFNAINFNPVIPTSAPAIPDAYRVTSSYSDLGSTFDPGSRVGQIVFRFNY
jgi:hypothetical protein